MTTLKQKWTEILPVFASVFFLIGIIWLIILGITKFATWASKPDTRTVEEVKIEKYKNCIIYRDIKNVNSVKECEQFLELRTN